MKRLTADHVLIIACILLTAVAVMQYVDSLNQLNQFKANNIAERAK